MTKTTTKTKKTKSKIERLRTWLLAGKSINPVTAMKAFGTLRLAALIFILRREGLNIVSNTRRGYATYKLETDS